MSLPARSFPPADARTGLRRLLPQRRHLAAMVVIALASAAALRPFTRNPFVELVGETLFVGIGLVFAYTAAGAWRQNWLPPAVAQVLAVALAAALSPFLVQMLSFGGDFNAFIRSWPHVRGYAMVTIGAAVIGLLFALGAAYSERDAQAKAQALQFALERETLERQAADARLHLMTAQIQPHFLLNTLANVQALVESGSPQAVPVFRSLMAYLRAAVPRLQQDDATLQDEERLVRAYLELMHMRMPDRLSFEVAIAPQLLHLRFPPMALLTLVENAIRHGIDPACDGGRVEVGGRRVDAQSVHLWVSDTGVGMAADAGTGTGLANLQARLQAFFGDSAMVELSEQQPHGLRADLRLQVAS